MLPRRRLRHLILRRCRLRLLLLSIGVQISGRLLDLDNGVRSSISPDYAKILIKLADSAEKEGITLDIRAMEVVYIADYAQSDETVLTPYLRLSEKGGVRYVNLNTAEIIKN